MQDNLMPIAEVKKINCLVVDDEPVARQGLEEYIREIDFLHLIDTCDTAIKAADQMKCKSVDLLFLDIHMPMVSGIDFLKTLRNPPLAIITTAYPEYALEGYSLDVIDYLLKPVTFDRFFKASQKAFEFYQMKHKTSGLGGDTADYFFVKCGGKYEKIYFKEVDYVEALQNYVVIHVNNRKLITYITFSGLALKLPQRQFIKVHKSYLVSIPAIKAIEGNEIILAHARIPISRSLRDEVIRHILGNNLFKR